jgi:hypothetical protein
VDRFLNAICVFEVENREVVDRLGVDTVDLAECPRDVVVGSLLGGNFEIWRRLRAKSPYG